MDFKDRRPFERQTLGEKPKYDAFTIWLNAEEREQLDYCKELLRQPKDSTALKTLAHLGYLKLIGDHSARWLLGVVVKNSYNNRKTGAVVDLPKPEESNGKSPENLTE